MLGAKTRLDTLVLSQGQTWVASFFPEPGTAFGSGTTAECILTDPAGVVLATWTPAAVSDMRIDFIVQPDEHDAIPHGAYYRVVAHLPASGPRPPIDRNLSRGSVVRDDNPSPLAAPRKTEIALTYIDQPDLAAGVNPNWVRVGGWGKLKVWDNSAQHLPPGLAADFILFDKTAARWRGQVATDAVKLEVSTILGLVNAGKTTVGVCSNQHMTSWVGFQMETGAVNNRLSIVTATGPTSYNLVASVNNVLHDNDRYTLIYDPIADKYLAYKSSDFSAPVLQWTDEDHSTPHGNGYRYPCVLFESSLLSTGVQLGGWAVKDN